MSGIKDYCRAQLHAAREECGMLSEHQFEVSRRDLVQKIAEIKVLLEDIDAELAKREDADHNGTVPNWAMRLRTRITEVL